MKIVSCVDDLLFSSKIHAAARALAVDIRSARGPAADIAALVKTEQPASVLLDLGRPDPIRIIQLLKNDAGTRSIPIIGFLSHVQTELYEEAVAAGCDRVMPRSQFSQNLPKILSGSF